MKYEIEHIVIKEPDFQKRLNELYRLAKERGFRKDNTLFITVQSFPGHAPTTAELIHQVYDYLKPAKFEMIAMGEYLESGKIRVGVNDDFRSTTHFHGIIKCETHELNQFAANWNRQGKVPGNKLFHYEPVKGNIYKSLEYFTKQLFKKPGSIKEPAIAFLKVKKKANSTNWLYNFVEMLRLVFQMIRLAAITVLVFLAGYEVTSPLLDTSFKNPFDNCIYGLPNGPPVTFRISIVHNI